MVRSCCFGNYDRSSAYRNSLGLIIWSIVSLGGLFFKCKIKANWFWLFIMMLWIVVAAYHVSMSVLCVNFLFYPKCSYDVCGYREMQVKFEGNLFKNLSFLSTISI